METQGNFTLLEVNEFSKWLHQQGITRKIFSVQQHHTWKPDYTHFKGDNHFRLQESMKDCHLARGFSDIAQHFTIFPDGKLCTGRPLNIIPAGIKGANTSSICIENLGNFDKNSDTMNPEHEKSLIEITAVIMKQFGIESNTEGILYHHWFDIITGKRTNGTGCTKSCPGTNFFGGNSVKNCNEKFIPLVKSKMNKLIIDNQTEESKIINTGYITADNLNVRSGPSSQYGILEVLNRTVQVNCYEIDGNWWRIHPWENKWVYNRYISEIGKMTEAELNDLFTHNAQEINKLKIAAGGIVKSLIMELKRRSTYIKLHNAISRGYKVNYIFLEGEEEMVRRIARALGFQRVTNSILEVRHA